MTSSSNLTAPATHAPLVTGLEADQLRATAAALTALAAAGSWALPQILISLATTGEGSISDLSRRTGIPIPTTDWTVRSGSTGRFIRPTAPGLPGRVVRPALPGLLHTRRAGAATIVSLGAAGVAAVRALQGHWQEDTSSTPQESPAR